MILDKVIDPRLRCRSHSRGHALPWRLHAPRHANAAAGAASLIALGPLARHTQHNLRERQGSGLVDTNVLGHTGAAAVGRLMPGRMHLFALAYLSVSALGIRAMLERIKGLVV
eukprot:scaffold9023_cov24-Tisochrysis_lutea.AAC.1